MFYASKMLQLLTLPSNLIALLGGIGLLALFLKWRRFGVGFLISAVLILIVAGWSPVGNAFLLALEERFPAPLLNGPIDGIVMLGGAIDTHITAERAQSTMNEAGERIVAAASLSREFQGAKILLSGGASHVLASESISESAIAEALLIDLGVDPERITIEDRSRDTCENAIESRMAASPDADEMWVLITSAAHMPRAVACFRAAGFPVIPYPVDYRTRGSADLHRPTASITDGLKASDLAAHEWLGLLSYRLFGRTSEFFPAR